MPQPVPAAGGSPDPLPDSIFRCQSALLEGLVVDGVDIAVTGGVITAIAPTAAGMWDVPGRSRVTVERLPGLVLPGFADAHSHVFHRALRGRTNGEAQQGGSFWTWRKQMYLLAEVLDPDSFRSLARAAYVEMVCAGITAVGEFHYLHHGPGGLPYADPNEMGLTAVDAGDEAGLRVTLLDVAYLAAGLAGEPLAPVQQRFSDGTGHAWADRVAALPAGIRSGVAIHSVRAVPPAALPVVVAAAGGRPLHVHLSEQPAENQACLAATGRTPTRLLADSGAWGPRSSAVHAIHLTDEDIGLLGAARATAVICPTTEADLADGLPRAGDLFAAGARLALGGDQHVVVDPFAQARGLEYGERLATGRRGTFPPVHLLEIATAESHRSIGSPAGRLIPGGPADLVAVDRGSARTAGSLGAQLAMSAAAQDVQVVVSGGRVVARDGVHLRLGAPGLLLDQAIAAAWSRSGT